MSISKINFTSQRKEIDIPQWVNRNQAQKREYAKTARIQQYDTYTPSKKSRKKHKNNLQKRLLLLATVAGVSGFAAPKVINNHQTNHSEIVLDDNTTNDNEITIKITQDDNDTDYKQPSKSCKDNEVVFLENEIIENLNQIDDYDKKLEIKAVELLETIKEKDKEADFHLENLRNSFNQSDIENLKFLIHLAQSPTWGNDCIDPLLFYAQICQESDCDSNALGDFSKRKQEYLARGFGQFHECAVDEVNEQIEKGTFSDFLYNNGEKYSYDDRTDPKKALEMMILLLRYDAQCTNSTDEMLAMYNRGHKNGFREEEGKNYVDKVYNRIGD